MRLRYAALLAVLCAAPGLPSSASDTPSGVESKYVPVDTFDPARDAAADIDRAVAEARRTGRRILLDIGGDWCPWCHQLDQLFQQYPDIRRLRDENFVTVKLYYGEEKKNEQVLSRYSKVLGIPHFFVLDKDGSLLHSQHVVELQSGGNYSPDKMKEFLSRWSPPPTAR
jgi:thiol:disulfide interchange protein